MFQVLIKRPGSPDWEPVSQHYHESAARWRTTHMNKFGYGGQRVEARYFKRS